jgi:hypothetical protein
MKNGFIKELGEGLILRHSTRSDADQLSEFIIRIHSNGTELDSRGLDAWTRDLLSGNHPTFDPGDFTIVEDTEHHQIVSCLNLISQTWAFDGIPFGMGRPELVGTLPDFRNRGLIRLQFDEIHRWSKARGELVQAITGIPNYYRQFGYEMAVNLGGGRSGSILDLPKLAKDQTEPYQIRPAGIADVPFILNVMTFGNSRYPLACLWTSEMLAYEISGKLESDINHRQVCLIENLVGEPVGFIAHPVNLLDSKMAATAYELKPGISWLEVTPGVARYLWAKGEVYAQRDGGSCLGFSMGLGEAHPAYQVIAHRQPSYRRPYAWYLRVPDLAAFISTVAPALEKRLAKSVCCGFHGELKISFYRSGLLLGFDHGKLGTIKGLSANELEKSNAAFTGLTFLQLLFGYRSLDEIRYTYPDCSADDDRAAPLLNALFPRMPSDLWEIS